jgi:riboflavin synthase
MFTGLIETPGQILQVKRKGQEGRFQICPHKFFSDIKLGESIAINGACLSVEEISGHNFMVYASQETLSRTNLGHLSPGDSVNLERALCVGARLGGHFVSGHVDCLCFVKYIRQVGESTVIGIEFPDEWSAFVVAKGSIALDGVSLTVNSCHQGFLEVNVIPATWKETMISLWKPSCPINMETDLIAKYVAQMLGPWTTDNTLNKTGSAGGLSEIFLKEHGFL